LVLLVFGFVCVVPVGAVTQQLANRTFETGALSPWWCTGSYNWVVGSGYANYTGVYGAYCYYSGCAIRQNVSVLGGNIVEFSLWAKCDTASKRIDVTVWYVGGTYNHQVDYITTGWVQYEYSAIIDDALTVASVQVSGVDSGVTFYVDDFSLLANTVGTGADWYDMPNYVSFIVLFVVCGLPAMVLGMAGAKDGWGLQGLLFGGLLGLGVGVCVGLVPFWFVFLIGLFLVLFMYSMVHRS
jgi:hypothetical protein